MQFQQMKEGKGFRPAFLPLWREKGIDRIVRKLDNSFSFQCKRSIDSIMQDIRLVKVQFLTFFETTYIYCRLFLPISIQRIKNQN